MKLIFQIFWNVTRFRFQTFKNRQDMASSWIMYGELQRFRSDGSDRSDRSDSYSRSSRPVRRRKTSSRVPVRKVHLLGGRNYPAPRG